MFGVDISGNQPADILSKIPCDFAIVKATGNPNTNGYAWNYVNPKMKQQADEALAKTGCLGLYCFAWGKDAITEADFFVDTIKDYIGKAIPFLDYEAPFSNQNRREWCRTFVRRVKERTGSTVGIYASSSVISAQNLKGLCEEEGCLLWSANYYKGYQVISGYDTSGMKMAIGGSDLWQFTSSGRLNGYSGNLDLDECYFTAEQWKAYASGKTTDAPTNYPTSFPKGEIMFRLLNETTKKHLFTENEAERDALVGNGWEYEGEAWKGTLATPIFRLYNPAKDDRMLTINEEERDALINDGYTFEGISGYSDGDVPIYRLFHPVTGEHMWTASEEERNALIESGWRDEGIGFYAVMV